MELEIKNSGCQKQKTSEVNLNNRLKLMEERIEGIESKVGGMDTSVKEGINLKEKNPKTICPGNLWHL